MNYLNLINKHDLHIANHIYTNDVLANMHISGVKKVAPSSTLQKLAETHENPILFLRKEAFGWRFRILRGMSTKTYGNNNQFTYIHLDKMSFLIQTERWSYGNGYSSINNKIDYQISASFSISASSFIKFNEAFVDLKDFVFEFIEKYKSIKDAADAVIKQQKELKKAA